MHLITYISRSTSPEDSIDDVLRNIVETAKIRNKARGITGVLFYVDQRFVQFIEGENEQLKILLQEIYTDSRHKDVLVIIDEPVYEREFKDWNMDYFNMDKNNSLNEANLSRFRDIYKDNFEMSSAAFIEFIKDMLSDPEMTKIMNT